MSDLGAPKRRYRWLLGAILSYELLLVHAGDKTIGKKGWVGAVVLDRPDDPDDCRTTSAEGDSLYVEYQVMINEASQGKNKLEFVLGKAPVEGWDEHLMGMCIDEERELTIPHTTHGHRNIGMKDDVPKDSVLQFQIRLLDINGSQRKSEYARWKSRDEQRASRKKKRKAEL